MPADELLEWVHDGRVADRCELAGHPVLKAREVRVSRRKQTFVGQELTQVLAGTPRWGQVEAGMVKGQGVVPEAAQQVAHGGVALPGVDRGRPVDTGQEVYQASEGRRGTGVGWAQQVGEVATQGAPGAAPAAVQLAFLAAGGAVEVRCDACARATQTLVCQARWCHAVSPAPVAGPVGRGCVGEAGAADVAVGPADADFGGCPAAPVATAVAGGPWAPSRTSGARFSHRRCAGTGLMASDMATTLPAAAGLGLRPASAAVTVSRSSMPQQKMSARAASSFRDTLSGRWMTTR